MKLTRTLNSLKCINPIPYSRKLSRDKTFMNWRKIRFLWKKFSQIAHWCHHQKTPRPPNFMKKLQSYKAESRMESWVRGYGKPEEVGHCMLPYIRDQILELAKDSLLVAVL